MCDWICYLIYSLTSNCTYIGSTNNFINRLNKHNTGKGAKYTKKNIPWIPILTISGFHHKNACLSFEAGWKKLSRCRANRRLNFINIMTDCCYCYTNDPKYNRIIDLLYFVNNFTLIDTKFKLNYDIKHPVFMPEELVMTIFMEDWIMDFPWPPFIEINFELPRSDT